MLKIDYGDTLNDQDIELALDGFQVNDESIDAFWIDNKNEVVYFAQFKSSINEKNMKSLDKKDLSYFMEIDDKLENTDYLNKHKNSRVRDITFDLRKKEHYDKKYLFYHMGHCNEDVLNLYRDKLEYSNFETIKDNWKSYISKTTSSKPEKCEIIINEYLDVSSSKEFKTLITTINGVSLYNLFDQYRNTLFEQNIRFYLGANDKVNKKIIETAKKNPEKFYYFNGGLTITCTNYKIKENKLKLDHPQIINGAQTIHSIVRAYKEFLPTNDEEKRLKHFEKLKVLVRIISSKKGESIEFDKDLTKFNNSQNKILERDFQSNKPEQEELQRRLSKSGYFYEIKRGERNTLLEKGYKHEKLKKTKFDFKHWDTKLYINQIAQIYQAYEGKPSSKETGADYILSNDDDYTNLFGSKKTDMNQLKVNNIIFAFNLFFFLDGYRKDYNKLLKLLNKLNLNKNLKEEWKKAKDLIKNIPFLNDVIKEKCDKDNYTDVEELAIKIIFDFSLFNTSKWFVLATIKFIIDKNGYMETIIEEKIFNNPDKISKIFSKKWLERILKNIKSVYDRQKKEKLDLTERAFLLNLATFKSITDYIIHKELDEGNSLKDQFKLNH